jgi:cytoskeletal protein RodZ
MFPDPASGIRERLDELLKEVKKPHWSVTPSFWLLVTSVVISIAALVVATRGLPQEQKPLTSNLKIQTAISAKQENVPRSDSTESNTTKKRVAWM